MHRPLLIILLILPLSAMLYGGEPLQVSGIVPVRPSPAVNRPLPVVQRILDKALVEVKKNHESFEKANQAPLGEARSALEALAKQLIDQGNPGDAIAVLQQITTLKADLLQMAGGAEDPGTLMSFGASVGKTLCFRVVGADSSGPIWGSNPYTADSPLAMAAVHAGVLKLGESGTVKVTVTPGQSSYEGSTKNGVTSGRWGEFPLSYRVEGGQSSTQEDDL